MSEKRERVARLPDEVNEIPEPPTAPRSGSHPDGCPEMQQYIPGPVEVCGPLLRREELTASVWDQDALFAALAKAQAEFAPIPKKNVARIPPKDGKSGYSYKYADLGDIMPAIQPALTKNGLCVTHRLVTIPVFALESTLGHSSGQSTTSLYPLGEYRTPQALGTAITYGRRYNISALTNCVADEDVDAAPAQAEQEEARPQARPANGGYREPQAQGGAPDGRLDDRETAAVDVLVGLPGFPADEKCRSLVLKWLVEPPNSYREVREQVMRLVAGVAKRNQGDTEALVKETMGAMRQQIAEREAQEAGL